MAGANLISVESFAGQGTIPDLYLINQLPHQAQPSTVHTVDIQTSSDRMSFFSASAEEHASPHKQLNQRAG